MSFDKDQNEQIESYSCPVDTCHGSVTFSDHGATTIIPGYWGCDECGWRAPNVVIKRGPEV